MYEPMGKLLQLKKLYGRRHTLTNLIKNETLRAKKKELLEEKIRGLQKKAMVEVERIEKQ